MDGTWPSVWRFEVQAEETGQGPEASEKQEGDWWGTWATVSVLDWRLTQGTGARSQLWDVARDLNFILRKLECH